MVASLKIGSAVAPRSTEESASSLDKKSSKRTSRRKKNEPEPEQVYLKGKGAWISRPSVVGQYSDPKYSKHVRLGAIQVRVFDLTLPRDVKALNVLLARAYPPSAPGISIDSDARVVAGNKWLCCVTFRVVEYQELLKFSSHV